MNIIPVDQKVYMVSADTNTVYSGSSALQAMSSWHTMGDLAMAASSPLTFTWTKANRNYVVIGETSVTYFELGVDFNCLVMEEGTNYTLLLDRHKQQKTKNASGKKLKTRYAHETVSDALYNERLSEIPITSATGQFFDFIPYKYFRPGEGNNPTGFNYNKGKTRGKTNSRLIRFVNLGFRIRIEKNGVITETGILGTIAMNISNMVDGFGKAIAYARPNS